MPEPNADPQPASGPRREGSVAALLVVGPFVLAAIGLLAVLVVALAVRGAGTGFDFRAYWDAGERLLEGRPLYHPSTLDGPFRPGPSGLYLYPPPLAVVLLPLHALGYDTAALAWAVARVGMLVGACAILPVPRWTRLAVFGTTALSYPALTDLNLGNVSLVVLALAAVGWRYLDRPAGSMAIAAAVALRSPFAILLLWQAVRRRWQALAWTLGAGAVMLGLTLPIVGIGGYVDYLRVLGNLREITGVPRNVDLSSTVLAVTGSPEVASLALLAGYAAAVGALLLSLRRDPETGYVTAVTATLLLSPLLWDHYLVLLALPAALLAARGWPAAIALPLLGWLPPLALPFTALVALVLPLVGPRARSPAHPLPGPRAADVSESAQSSRTSTQVRGGRRR